MPRPGKLTSMASQSGFAIVLFLWLKDAFVMPITLLEKSLARVIRYLYL